MAPRVILVMCGTNDLRDAKLARDDSSHRRVQQSASDAVIAAAPEIASRQARIFELIVQRLPAARVIFMHLLPRHKAYKAPPLLWDSTNPYYLGVLDLNRRQAQMTAKYRNVTVIDCGQSFLADDGAAIIPEMLPDCVHPSTLGAVKLAKCIGAGIVTALRHNS